MVLFAIQKSIEKIYKINTGMNVCDYLISKDLYEKTLNDSGSLRVNSQTGGGCLLLSQRGDDLDIGVYLDKKIVNCLIDEKPFILNNKNLNSFYTAVEEVSHFIYAVFNAFNDRPFTKLEMELQAEVDKFLTTYFYYRKSGKRIIHKDIKKRLFFNVTFDSTLKKEDLQRYKLANKTAHNYCLSLENKYLKNKDLPGLIKDVRIFYRKNKVKKFEHINNCG